MPAKDRYHNHVVCALRKDGWKITSEQYALILDERRVWVDIRTEKASGNRIILIEVKGFENMPSPVDYLAATVGQYIVYQATLDYLESDDPLYLAVPEAAYNGILSETIGQQVIHKAAIRLMVFDPKREEIVRWLD